MTRTQKLGLCTWLPEDPVCLAEVNDNFTRLDASGGRALRLAEAAMVNLGGLMAAQAHAGGHAAYSETISVDAFCDTEYIESYDGVYLRGKKLELLSSGLGNGTVTGGTNITPGGGDYNASDVQRQISTKKAWSKLFDFQPDAYGSLTQLTLQTVDSASSSTASHMKLSIWDAAAGEMLCETEMATITHVSGSDRAVSYAVDLLLDPNRSYVMKLWIQDMPMSSMLLGKLSFTITPLVHTSGSVTTTRLSLPEGYTRAELLVHGTPDAPQPLLRFDEGTFAAAEALGSKPDTLPGGAESTLWRFGLSIPDGSKTAQLRLRLPSAGCKVYDYALILL